MNSLPLRRSLEEVCEICGVSVTTVKTFIESEWVVPLDPHAQMLDDEDIARIRLILELKNDFEVNDQSIDIILHLIDRIHVLNLRLKQHLED